MFRQTGKYYFLLGMLLLATIVGCETPTGSGTISSAGATLTAAPPQPIVVEREIYVPVTVTPSAPETPILLESLSTPTLILKQITPSAPAGDNQAVAVSVVSSPSEKYKYEPAVLESPAANSKYWCRKPLVLSWKFDAELAPDEWFVLEATKTDHPNDWFGINEWVKERTATLNPEKYDDGSCSAVWWDGVESTYRWRVRVVKGDQSTHTIQQDVALPSKPHKIYYSQSDGGCQ